MLSLAEVMFFSVFYFAQAHCQCKPLFIHAKYLNFFSFYEVDFSNWDQIMETLAIEILFNILPELST